MRIPELDGVRGLAILLVLVWHFVIVPIQPVAPSFLQPLWVLLGLSWTGVDLFFVLSGFLIGGILLDNRESPVFFKAFYFRRICRIFPIYYFLVFLYFALASYGFGNQNKNLAWLMNNPMPAWSYLTFTQNFLMSHRLSFGCGWLGVTWSLAIEEQFYLLLPFVLYFLPKKRVPFVLICGICMAPLIRGALMYFENPAALAAGFVMMPCRADALLLGVLGAYILRLPGIAETLLINKRRLYLIFSLFLAGVACLAVYSPVFMSPAMNWWGRSWLALFFLLFVLIAVIDTQGFLAKSLRSRVLGGLGNISYGVYLLHQVVFSLTLAFLFPSATRTASVLFLASIVSIVFVIGSASIFYHFVEKPIIRFGHRIKY